MDKPKVGPKDFFMYLSAMAALYVSVVSIITLLFQYINTLFPDALSYYPEGYSSSMRFAIASLIIIFPLYIVLTRLLNQDLRRHTEKKDIWVRKWLVYLTLFVAGITIVVDLIWLINTFLGGEVTTRFILKALSVFVVVGGGFMYYLYDLKGVWERNERASKIYGLVAALVVVVAVIGGFFVVGSPAIQRLLAFDRQKVSDLQTIQYQVVNYWQQKERLPVSLDDLEDPISGFKAPVDPQTKEAYGYAVAGDLSLKLCATFNKESRVYGPKGEIIRPIMPGYGYDALGNATWDHEAGDVCFDRTIDPDLYPPTSKR